MQVSRQALREAREWLADCGIPAGLDNDVRRAVAVLYYGGWDGFMRDGFAVPQDWHTSVPVGTNVLAVDAATRTVWVRP